MIAQLWMGLRKPNALDEAVNKPDLSTGEMREFAGKNVAFSLNPKG